MTPRKISELEPAKSPPKIARKIARNRKALLVALQLKGASQKLAEVLVLRVERPKFAISQVHLLDEFVINTATEAFENAVYTISFFAIVGLLNGDLSAEEANSIRTNPAGIIGRLVMIRGWEYLDPLFSDPGEEI